MSGDGKRSVAAWPKLPRPSSTLPSRRFVVTRNSVAIGGIADLSERLVQTNSVENDPTRTLPHRSDRLGSLAPASFATTTHDTGRTRCGIALIEDRGPAGAMTIVE